MNIIAHTSIETLASRLLEDVFSKENFAQSHAGSAKGIFLTGGNVLVCESRGLQEYLKKTCVDKYGIWTALSFKPLAGLLMQCAYNLSPKELKKDEQESIFNEKNLVWAIYKSLDGIEKTFSFACEIASMFFTYQIYRPEIIEKWNNKEPYAIENSDKNFEKNEEFQRNLWIKLKEDNKHEPDISQLYKLFAKSDKKVLPRQIFIFAPLSIAQVQLSALKYLSQAGCKVNLYLLQISKEYIGDTKSDKSVVYLRKKSWEENKIADEDRLYWDLGNRLIANLGRSAQVLYEQIGWDNLEYIDEYGSANSLLGKIQSNIINDNNEKTECKKDCSITFSNCFSPLREVEVLHDYILDLFAKNEKLTPADIAIVAPNIENYAGAIEIVFGRNNILPYKIADRDIKKYDKTLQLLNLLFSLTNGRYYEAPDIVALFEYSMFVQGKELESIDRERLAKWVKENAIRHGLENFAEKPQKPDYSFKSGFEQLAAGFFMISQTGFSDKKEYCYPDIEGNSARILGDFACFAETLRKFDEESQKEKSIRGWDEFFSENLQIFFGTDKTDFNEDKDNPYQKIISAWDSLKKEMLIGFNNNENMPINFAVLKVALPKKLEANAKSPYSLSGKISCSNLETVRAIPHKVICCVGMNGKEFPRQKQSKDINLMAKYKLGDKDIANEDRLMFLEIICNARENLYISWIGQDDKTADELEPSSVVVMLLKNLDEQYKIKANDLVTKHPLQPFSKKYFSETGAKTYDNRWINPVNSRFCNNAWKWELDNSEVEENEDINALFKALSDSPKYFLKDMCNIILPEDIELLESLEPFVIEEALDEWKLADLILRNDSRNEYMKEIEILKLRGDLPNGKFADRIIDSIAAVAEELKAKANNEKEGSFWIYPSSDKGKYRLKHWLYHLDLNKFETRNTKMFLKDIEPIELKGMPKEKAKEILDKLWKLKRELEKRMRPIFPDAAWKYLTEKEAKRMSEAKRKIFGREERDYAMTRYSKYAEMIIGDAESFEDLGIKEEAFAAYSESLFNEYNNYLKGDGK